jgi:hypothetical protein
VAVVEVEVEETLMLQKVVALVVVVVAQVK